jgi:deazaflavin-dependent oxidoreductase (nitroreductase family)
MWINSVMAWVLKSPLHSLISKNMLLITVTGRKSGKSITTPTAYLREGNTLWIISQRSSKWWRNLRGGANAMVVLGGKRIQGHGSMIEDEQAVAQRLFDNFKTDAQRARFAQVRMDEKGLPVFEDCERTAKKMLAVKIELSQ